MPEPRARREPLGKAARRHMRGDGGKTPPAPPPPGGEPATPPTEGAASAARPDEYAFSAALCEKMFGELYDAVGVARPSRDQWMAFLAAWAKLVPAPVNSPLTAALAASGPIVGPLAFVLFVKWNAARARRHAEAQRRAAGAEAPDHGSNGHSAGDGEQPAAA